jgi:hypothetical protein
MSSTRLLVLGVVRIFQPAHGYRLTADGETEFLALLREEVVAALESRVAQLEAAHRGTGFAVDTVRADPTKPSQVAELLLLGDAQEGV